MSIAESTFEAKSKTLMAKSTTPITKWRSRRVRRRQRRQQARNCTVQKDLTFRFSNFFDMTCLRKRISAAPQLSAQGCFHSVNI